MEIKAINNYCTLELIRPAEEVKKGVILLPGITSQTPRWATVTSVGDGVPDVNGTFYTPDVQVGDVAYVTAHGQYAVYKNANEEVDVAAASVLDILAIMKNMETLEIQPLGSYIEIEKVEFNTTNEFGIELPDNRKVPTNVGIVKTIGLGWRGPDGTPVPFQISIGQKVVYNPLRTMVVDFNALGKDEKTYLVMHNDIIGIVNE